jgi:hypothetical protein
MLTIPLSPVPSQTLSTILAGQDARIAVYTENTGLYFDVSLGSTVIKTAVRMRDGARLLQDTQYAGFVGDFVCVDTQGELDPDYPGLGGRFQLVYLEAADLVTYASL